MSRCDCMEVSCEDCFPKIEDLSELIANHRLRELRDSRIYPGEDKAVYRCGWRASSNTDVAHMLCMWMYHQRGKILEFLSSSYSFKIGEGLSCQGYLDVVQFEPQKTGA